MGPKRKFGSAKITGAPATAALKIPEAVRQHKLFGVQSRREFRVVEAPSLEERLRAGDKQDDTAGANRVAFAIMFKALDFTASLMNPTDKLFFTREPKPGQPDTVPTVHDLYKLMNVYHQHLSQQFPEGARQEMEVYMTDMAAGIYDLADAFFNVRAEYRPQLLHLVTKFRAGQVNLEHHGQIPEALVEATADQITPLRLYGQYFEHGFRIVQLNNTEKQVGTYSGYKELELLREGNSLVAVDALRVTDDETIAIDLETLARRCQEALNKIANGSGIAAVGIVKAEFALKPGQIVEVSYLPEQTTPIEEARLLSRRKHGESIEITPALAQALLDDKSGEEFTVLTIGGKEGDEGQREIYVGQGRAYADEQTAKEIFRPNQLTPALDGSWKNIKPVSFLRVVGAGGYYLSFTGDE